MARSPQQQDLAYWYVDFTIKLLRLAEQYFIECRYPETIDSAQDAIEFALKAIFEFAGQQYPQIHEISRRIPNLSNSFPGLTHEFSRAAILSSRWLGSTHAIPRYGQQRLGVAPRTLFPKREVRQALRDSREVYRLMMKCLTQIKRQFSRRVAILDGYVEGRRYREQPCSTAPYTNYSCNQWRQAFESILLPNGNQKYDISEIGAANINSRYPMIINPFGEAYPEKDVEKRPMFNRIKDYVWGGGIFVTAGGFAFFYAWDVTEGTETPISETRTLVPSSILWNRQTGQAIIQQMTSAIEFTGTLLWKELGALTTSDTQNQQGSFLMQVSQTRSDQRKAGNLASIGGSSDVQEFRALRSETRNLIPLLRGTRSGFGEVYPIAAIKYGQGYFLTNGMNLISTSEFEKSVFAADRFLNWTLR